MNWNKWIFRTGAVSALILSAIILFTEIEISRYWLAFAHVLIAVFYWEDSNK